MVRPEYGAAVQSAAMEEGWMRGTRGSGKGSTGGAGVWRRWWKRNAGTVKVEREEVCEAPRGWRSERWLENHIELGESGAVTGR
jgi:hypothetical protein